MESSEHSGRGASPSPLYDVWGGGTHLDTCNPRRGLDCIAVHVHLWGRILAPFIGAESHLMDGWHLDSCDLLSLRGPTQLGNAPGNGGRGGDKCTSTKAVFQLIPYSGVTPSSPSAYSKASFHFALGLYRRTYERRLSRRGAERP
jgi:hypothetical protein